MIVLALYVLLSLVWCGVDDGSEDGVGAGPPPPSSAVLADDPPGMRSLPGCVDTMRRHPGMQSLPGYVDTMRCHPGMQSLPGYVDTAEILQRFMSEKALLELDEETVFASAGEWYKRTLMRTLVQHGWDEVDLEIVKHAISDPRAEFFPALLRINSTHQETEALYGHQLTRQSVDRCMKFWEDEGDRIKKAAKPYGVPPEIIVAILKIETNLGLDKGNHAVFNVFWSLSLADHPAILKRALTDSSEARNDQRKRLLRRAKWGRSQLYELISMVRDGTGEWILWEKGSWAGAFGLPQFIPASFRSYGRDGNGDNKIDLDDICDSAASIAYYLKANGWRGKMNQSRKKKVIMRYNYSTHYADAVLNLVDLIHNRLAEKGEGG